MNKLPNRRRTPTFVSVFAPTFRVTLDEKFYSDLQSTLNEVNGRDLLLLVGYFNARVGSTANSSSEETWNGVREIHGVGRMNGAGADQLTFCVLNELTFVNTCSQRKILGSILEIRNGTVSIIPLRSRKKASCGLMLVWSPQLTVGLTTNSCMPGSG